MMTMRCGTQRENALRKVLDDLGIDYTEEIGEAAFYGPKLDVNVKPAIGNEYTLSTCQLDFCLPAKFNLTYIDKDGTKKTPVVLHRAILGSLDRFMAYILEETKGNLPLWLAPVQARIIPVKNEDEELNAYSHELLSYLDENGIRVEIDERAEKLGYRVRAAQVESSLPHHSWQERSKRRNSKLQTSWRTGYHNRSKRRVPCNVKG